MARSLGTSARTMRRRGRRGPLEYLFDLQMARIPSELLVWPSNEELLTTLDDDKGAIPLTARNQRDEHGR